LAAEFSLDYLSGLLVGEELRGALAGWRQMEGAPLALTGEVALCERYVRALTLFGVAEVPVITRASAAGLWRIAEPTLI
jgi:2-dehydro-3-deoxygalactonokinase